MVSLSPKMAQNGFILDDGFQHLALQRDVDIVLLDATDSFGGGGILPAGRLREPCSGLARADIVVITRASEAPAVDRGAQITQAIFYAQARLDAVLRAPSMKEILPEIELPENTVLLFVASVITAAFFDDLRIWNFYVVGQRSFADHHHYSGAEIRDLESVAAAAGAHAFICTEKDMFDFAAFAYVIASDPR